MDRQEEFRQRLEATFRQEAADHLQAFVTRLLALENDPDGDLRETIETAYREMHSLKGAAAVVGRTGVTLLCQAVESYFAELQKGQALCSRQDLDVLHLAADHLGQMLASPGPVAANEPRLQEVIASVLSCGSDASGAGLRTTSRPEAAVETAPERPASVRVTAEKVSSIVWHTEQLVAARASGSYLVGELARIRKSVFEARYRSGRRDSAPDAAASKALLRELEPALAHLERFAVRHQHRLVRSTEDLRDEVRSLSFSPAQTMLDAFPKIVRDLARELGKQARVEIVGGEIELDRRVLDQLREPLLHLVRNAVGHGLEAPAGRAGKADTGVIRFEVRPVENQQVELTVSDDGAGIDFERIAQQAVLSGSMSPQELDSMDDQARRDLVFLSGLSTHPQADNLAGRGLGLSIVRTRIQNLGGTIAVESRRGAGAVFRIRLALQVATLRGVLVESAGFRLVVPVSGVYRAGRLAASSIRHAGGKPVAEWNGSPLPVLNLAELLGMKPALAPGPGPVPVLYLGVPAPVAVLCVDGVLAEQEFLLQPMHPPIRTLHWYVGMALSGEGGILPVLHLSKVVRAAARPAMATAVPVAAERRTERPRTILLAEDTITSRVFLKNLLETHGYKVHAFGDGEEAWKALQEMTCDLVLSDVEMPTLNGYELTGRIRGDERFQRLPVVLVTALDSIEHRQQGSSAGADAYLVKQQFDHEQLLATIARLIHD